MKRESKNTDLIVRMLSDRNGKSIKDNTKNLREILDVISESLENSEVFFKGFGKFSVITTSAPSSFKSSGTDRKTIKKIKFTAFGKLKNKLGC